MKRKRRLRYKVFFRMQRPKICGVFVRKLADFLGLNEYNAVLLSHPLNGEFDKWFCAYLLPYSTPGLTQVLF